MLRLITDGPGWTDDITFFRWVSKDNGQPRLIGYNSASGTSIIFTDQSFDDAVAALLTVGEWYNEDDGTHNYIEGDNPDLFNAVDWYEDDNATEDQFFEDADEFDNVSDYLEQLGYSSEETSEEKLYYRDEAEDYLKAQGIDVEDEDVSELLDETGWWSDQRGGYMFTQEDLDNIVNQFKK